jgi:hypothetical protein
MRILAALQTVLAGAHDNSHGILRWVPALWSALASLLVSVVSAVMGLHILAALFLGTAAALLFLTVISIAVVTAARLKETPDA